MSQTLSGAVPEAKETDGIATQVAERLDTEVLELLHQATGVPAPTAP